MNNLKQFQEEEAISFDKRFTRDDGLINKYSLDEHGEEFTTPQAIQSWLLAHDTRLLALIEHKILSHSARIPKEVLSDLLKFLEQ